MLVATTGTFKPVRVTFHTRSGLKSSNRSLPIILPFASILLFLLNIRVLLAPTKPSLILVTKVALKQVLACMVDLNLKSFLRITVIHIIFTPLKFKNENIVSIDSDALIAASWVSRFVQVRGIAANSYSNTHEDDFRRSFNKTRVHILWSSSHRNIGTCNPLIRLKTNINVSKVSESNLLEKGKINFVSFENTEVIHGNYVIHNGSFIRNIPYEISGFNTFPQSNLIVTEKEFYRQEVSFKIEADEGLFIGSSTNWYHFLVEVLPRGILWQKEFSRHLPIIFHKPIPDSINRILGAIGGVEPILISDGESAYVNSLIVALDGRFDLQPDMLAIVADKNIFTERISDLEMIANWLRKSFPTRNRDFPKKVFLARGKDSLRPMSNFNQVQQYLEGLGYVTVFPEKLSIEDQIELFTNIESLVAEGGAALTGLIFANNLKSVVHIEANPNFFVANFWQQFSEILNLNARACLGIPESFLGYPTGRFSVILDDLKKILLDFEN